MDWDALLVDSVTCADFTVIVQYSTVNVKPTRFRSATRCAAESNRESIMSLDPDRGRRRL